MLTDDGGRYELANVPPGRYTLTAFKEGFLELQHGQRRAHVGGQPIHVKGGETVVALSEAVGGLLFATGLFFRPACLALIGVMTFATIEQYARPMPQPEHALKNAFLFAGMFLVGSGRYAIDQLFVNRRRRW